MFFIMIFTSKNLREIKCIFYFILFHYLFCSLILIFEQFVRFMKILSNLLIDKKFIFNIKSIKYDHLY
jgi:hypothetical protein